jgi:hypothetical protein
LVIPHDSKSSKSDFSLAKEQLMLEQEIIIKGLEKMGMTARQLTGLEILDLFYNFYNLEQAKIQPLVQAIVRQTHEQSFI